MEIFILVYTVFGLALMANMAFVIAKYNGRNPWLWAALTVVFGALPLAYVFFSKNN